MYRGFVLLRTDNKEISDFIEDIFIEIPILIKINKNANVKELLESSIKAVLLDKKCKEFDRLFNEFSKRGVGIISIGNDADIVWPFNKEEILEIIEKTEIYIPEIKKFNIKLNLSEAISSLKNESLDRRKINEEIINKYLESNKSVKDDDKKSLSNILKSKLYNQLISEKVDKDKKKEVKKSDLKTKVLGFFGPFKEKGLKRKKVKKLIIKSISVRKGRDRKNKDDLIKDDLTELSSKEINDNKISSKDKRIGSKNKNISVLIFKVKDK